LHDAVPDDGFGELVQAARGKAVAEEEAVEAV
jgi:hypothetical protein